MLGTVDLKIRLEARLTQDGDDWIAFCPPLDLYTQSDSRESAMNALREAISAWFESCLERRVLARALEEVGFQLVKAGEPVNTTTVQVAPAPASRQVEEVEVSIPAYIAAAMNSPAHASC